MKIASLLTPFLMGAWLGYAQEVELQLKDSVRISGTLSYADELGQLYVQDGDALTKFSAKGDSMFSYSDKLLGEIDQVDLTLPMRPILFYKSLNQILVTDNTLTPQANQEIALEELNWPQVTLVAASFNNNKLWLYDYANFELLQTNRQLQVEQRSGNLQQLLGFDSLDPIEIRESQNRIYVNDSTLGLLAFDLFGTYYNTLHLKGIERFDVIDANTLIYLSNREITIYNTQIHQSKSFPFPINNPDSIVLVKSTIYFSKNGWVYRWVLSNP